MDFVEVPPTILQELRLKLRSECRLHVGTDRWKRPVRGLRVHDQQRLLQIHGIERFPDENRSGCAKVDQSPARNYIGRFSTSHEPLVQLLATKRFAIDQQGWY